MISSKSLILLARKWKKVAAMHRRRVSFPRSAAAVIDSSAASKGHFVVYTTDERRFIVPLEYLGRHVFVELLRLSEEEFGLPSDGPITLPCDSTFLSYAMSLDKEFKHDDLEKALLTPPSACHFSASSSSGLGKSHQHKLIYS